MPGGDTRNIADPTYKTLNLLTRLSTYLQDFEPTYETFKLLTMQKQDRILDFQPTYESLNLNTRHKFSNIM